MAQRKTFVRLLQNLLTAIFARKLVKYSWPGFFVTEIPTGVVEKKFNGVAHVGPTEAKTKNRFKFKRVKGKERDMVIITS